MIRQQDKVRYGTITIPYNVIKTGRTKTSELIVDADTIIVRAPLDKDKFEIQKIVLEKARWILKKQKEYRETIPEITKPSFKKDTTLPYLGNNYSITIIKKQSKDSIDLVDEKFEVKVKSSKNSPSQIKKLWENWLREKAQDVFEEKVELYSKKLRVKVNRIAIKNIRNRWGSLTNSSVINLNVNLIKAPEDVIDYIILHELCHLQIKEHSYQYWNLLHKFMPNYHNKIEWLNSNGSNLL